MLLKSEQSLLNRLHANGVFLIDMTKGFEFSAHEKKRNAERSPLKVNLRPAPDGNLTKELTADIAQAIFDAVQKVRIPYDAISGIPRAGVPLAKEFKRIHEQVHRQELPYVCLRKEILKSGNRSFKVAIENRASQRGQKYHVLLIDDLVTEAVNKLKAKKALERAGHDVIGIGVYLDWERGGYSQLTQSGLKVAVAMRISKALRNLRDSERISKEVFESVEKFRTAD